MGMRICKMMGYALTDLEYDDDTLEIVDSRINSDLKGGWWYNIADGFEDWIENNREEAKRILLEDIGVGTLTGSVFRTGDDRPTSEPVTYAPEMGLPNVLLFQPLSARDWSQYDSPLDYYEHRISGRPMCNVVDVLESESINGFWPYDIAMFRHPDRETPEELIEAQPEHIKEGIESFNLRKGSVDGSYWNTLVCEEWESETTPEFKEHLLKDWNCGIPADILLFAHWSGIFKEFNTAYTLRPVIYTYWS